MFKKIKIILIILLMNLYFYGIYAKKTFVEIPPCTFCGLAGEQPNFLCTLRDSLKVLPKYDVQNSDEKKLMQLGGGGCYLLSGPSGTGKKAVAKAIAREAEVPIQIYNMLDLDDKNDGAKKFTAVEQIYKDADQQVALHGKPVILVFTNVDKDNEYQWCINHRVDDHWRDPYVLTILTVRDLRGLHEATLSRSTVLKMELPNVQVRQEIIKMLAQKYTYDLSNWQVDFMGKYSDELSGGDIENIFKKYEKPSALNKLLLAHSLTRKRHVTEKVISSALGILALPLVAYLMHRFGKDRQIMDYFHQMGKE